MEAVRTGSRASLQVVEADRKTWDAFWRRAPFPPLTQAWEYGNAKAHSDGLNVRRCIVHGENGPESMLQILCRRIPVVGGIARINRGPVWLNEQESADCERRCGRVLDAIRRLSIRHRWFHVRFAPNWSSNEITDRLTEQAGLLKKNVTPYGSASFRIDRAPDLIRHGFHHEWQRNLKKVLKLGLELEEPPLLQGLSDLVEKYSEMKQVRGFSGIPNELLFALAAQQGPRWHPRVTFALKDGRRIGGSMCLGHGDALTYLVGWSSDEGRELLSSYFLFWNSMLHFGRLGYRHFDVGGLDASTMPGIARFKKRMNGTPYLLAGEYDWLPFVPKALVRLLRRKAKVQPEGQPASDPNGAPAEPQSERPQCR